MNIRKTTYLTPMYDLKKGLYYVDARVIPFDRCNGKELNELIMASVNHSQKWLETELPSQLIVTQKQFASLNPFTDEMYHTTDRMFKVLTPEGGIMCIMEVQIDREIDTIDMIDEIIEESEEQLGQRDFSKMEAKKMEIDPTKPNVLTPDNFKNQI